MAVVGGGFVNTVRNLAGIKTSGALKQLNAFDRVPENEKCHSRLDIGTETRIGRMFEKMIADAKRMPVKQVLSRKIKSYSSSSRMSSADPADLECYRVGSSSSILRYLQNLTQAQQMPDHARDVTFFKREHEFYKEWLNKSPRHPTSEGYIAYSIARNRAALQEKLERDRSHETLMFDRRISSGKSVASLKKTLFFRNGSVPLELPVPVIQNDGNARVLAAFSTATKAKKRTDLMYSPVEFTEKFDDLKRILRPFTYCVIPAGAEPLGVVTYVAPNGENAEYETHKVVEYEFGKMNAIVCGPVFELYTVDIFAKFNMNVKDQRISPKGGEMLFYQYKGAPITFEPSWSRRDNGPVCNMTVRDGDYLVKAPETSGFSPSRPYRIQKDAFEATYETVK